MNKYKDLKCKVKPEKLQYDYPIYYMLTEDKGDPDKLNNQLKFFMDGNVKLFQKKFKGQSQEHWYAVFLGESKEQADIINREQYRILKQEQRRQERIIENEISLDLLAEDGFEVSACGQSTEVIIEYNEYIESLLKEYRALNPKDQRIFLTFASGFSMRKSATMLGVPYSTYKDKSKKIRSKLRKKLKEFDDYN